VTDAARPPRWHPRGLNNELIVSATYRGVTRLPTWLTYRIGRVGTWLAYHLMKNGTRALVENFQGVFPDRSPAELRRLALLTYRSYARDTIDFMRSLELPADVMRKRVSRLETEAFDVALARGRGAIALSGHFGNWELAGVLLRRFTTYPLAVVAMREPDAQVSRLRERLRAKLGIETIEVRQGVETAIMIRRLLQQNRVVGMLLDRHLARDHVEVRFFGRRAFFLRTPAMLAYFSGAPLILSFVYRDENDRLVVECGPAIDVPRSGDRDEHIRAATQEVASAIERQIRARPHYWYQFYPFWASQEQLLRDEPSAGDSRQE
jgi:Kdo2-lipid IVA lauroyltransferase/acyltransferase